MKIHLLVEGPSEETFVIEVLRPHLQKYGVEPNPVLVTTKRTRGGPTFKGGVSSYQKIKNDLHLLLCDTSAKLVTTMLDFYRLPRDFPGRKTLPRGSCYKRIDYLEAKFQADIGHRRFLPYLQLHEFEAMVFASPEHIARAFPERNALRDLRQIKDRVKSPEEINDKMPPSKRLGRLVPEYEKPLHGPLIILEIGLDRIRGECPHFDNWLTKLESLGKS
jgi:hypothetical protein